MLLRTIRQEGNKDLMWCPLKQLIVWGYQLTALFVQVLTWWDIWAEDTSWLVYSWSRTKWMKLINCIPHTKEDIWFILYSLLWVLQSKFEKNQLRSEILLLWKYLTYVTINKSQWRRINTILLYLNNPHRKTGHVYISVCFSNIL